MPAAFAVGDQVIGNPEVASFAAFGSFAMLLLVDFGGPMRARLQAQAALAVTGALFVCLGTLASRSSWLGAAAMTVLGFGVLFAGVASSALAGATTSLLLAFILSVSLTGPISSIPDRLAGWGIASAAALLAVALLWPAPERDPLRGPAMTAMRALAARLRSDVRRLAGGEDEAESDREAVIARTSSAVDALHRAFFATPYRPAGLGTPARMLVRLVDELKWLYAITIQSPARPEWTPVNLAACAVKSAASTVLESGADLLDVQGGRPDALRAALAKMHEALFALEQGDNLSLPALATDPGSGPSPGPGPGPGPGADRIDEFISSLDPGFRAQELSFAVSQIAANIDLLAAAERRSWSQRMLGHQPSGLAGPLSAAQTRAGAHIDRHSVWLHNSVRGAVALGAAVLVAKLTGVQHSFWVVLGTLSVLRSNALSTGQTAVNGLIGTIAGFIVGAAIVVLVGTNTTLLWFLLPLAVLLAGLAPAAISFAAGQAAFTLTLLILFNIVQPTGWRLGLVRIEDIALGCAVSLVVGLLFWPRGAGAALRVALAEAYTDSVRYLAGAVEFGMGRCDSGTPSLPAPTSEAVRASAASTRLDDTFRGYLAERGAKRIPLAEVTGLLTGVAGLRLAADAVLDLWHRDDAAGGDRTAARRELLASTQQMVGWYDGFAAALTGHGEVPEPMPHDDLASGRLLEAVSRDLRRDDGRASATAARVIWTGDHLDATRRLQAGLVGPALQVHPQRAHPQPAPVRSTHVQSGRARG